ncbi:MAG TPA: hypothetical protein VH415_10720 [Nitrososphaeraceae archaeon]|jgi:hypothetical protein
MIFSLISNFSKDTHELTRALKIQSITPTITPPIPNPVITEVILLVLDTLG